MYNHTSQVTNTKNLREPQEWDMTSLGGDLLEKVGPESAKESHPTAYE